MTDERLLQLVSAAADGQLSDAEKEELERLLPGSAEARAFQQDLERLDAVLGDIPPATPPPDLLQRIINVVPAGKAATTGPARVNTRGGWLQGLLPVPALRYGLAAAAGLLLAVAFYETGQVLPGDTSQMVGTVAPAAALDRFSFRQGGVASEASLARQGDGLLLDIEVTADRPLEVEIDFGASGARIGSLVQSKGPVDSMEFTGQTLRFRATGRRQLTVQLHRNEKAGLAREASIALEYSSSGKLLRQGALIPTW